MSDPNTLPAEQPPPLPSRKRGLRIATFTAIALAGALTGAAATKALSHGYFGHHWHQGHGFLRTHGGFMGGPLDPARAEERAERMAKHLGVEIDATKEQQEKLVTIAKGLAKDLLPVREKIRAARARGLELMTQPTVDRAAVEQLRAEQMANIDAVSQRIAAALADAAEVMTPEQRKVLAERVKEFREHGWGHWRKG